MTKPEFSSILNRISSPADARRAGSAPESGRARISRGECGRRAVLWKLMGPLIISNILQQLYNTIDAFVIGRYTNESCFAAIGVASAVMNLFLFLLFGACTGVSILFSELYGRRDLKSVRRLHFESTVLGLAFSAPCAAVGILILPLLFALIQVPSALTGLVREYLFIILLGLPAAFEYNLCSALLRSVSRTGAVLLILVACVASNTVLDVIFVAGLGLGLHGAASATVLAEILSALLGLLYLKIRTPALMFGRADCRFDRSEIRRIASMSALTAMQQSGLYIGKLLVQGVVNSAGPAIIAGFTAACRIEGFANSFGESGTTASSVVIAQSRGAGRSEDVRAYDRTAMRILTGLGLLMAALMFVFARPAVHLLIPTSGAAFENAVAYLRVISAFYVLDFTGSAFVGYFNGIGRVSIPVIGSTSHIMLRFVLSYFLIGRMGLSAVALSCGIGWMFVNVFWGILKKTSEKKEGRSALRVPSLPAARAAAPSRSKTVSN